MNAEILCIGTELMLGDIVNTNAQYLSQQLTSKGIDVHYQSSVGDNAEQIIKALSVAVTRSNLIIFTGGLDPTADDITIETVSKALGIELEKNEEAHSRLVNYFKKTGKKLTDNNFKQAFLPKGSIMMPNDCGTAPGCIIESGNQCIAFLPGPTEELKVMYQNYLSAYLDRYSTGIITSKFVHIYGVGESAVDEMAKDLIKSENPTVAPYAKQGEVELRVTATSKTYALAEICANEMVEKIKSLFGDSVYGYENDSLESVLVETLKQQEKTIATAESCTAGYISKRITDISGASKVFKMGVTTYSNESKSDELGVPAHLIKKHGAVSREVAACMARGIRQKSGADIGLSITGIAGPKSDDSNKPVGLSYIGISDETGEYVIKSMKSPEKDREYIRYTSASEALNFVRLHLLNGAKNLDVQKFDAVMLELTATPKEEKAFEKSAKKVSPVTTENIDNVEDENIQETEETEDKKPLKRALNISRPVQLSKEELDEAMLGGFLEQQNEKDDIVSEVISLDNLDIKPKFNDEANAKVNIIIDESDYVPVDDPSFVERDKALEEYEKQLVKEHEKGFAKKVLIQKTDTKKEVARKITLYTALVVFICTVLFIIYFLINPVVQQHSISKMSEEIEQKGKQRGDYYSEKINPKFQDVYNKNQDFIGWIKIKGTNINYPVMQSKEVDYYLRRGFNKAFSSEGSIFADTDVSIEYKNESKNIMLYGHHMTSTDTMFRQLDNYLSVDFYKKNPNIVFDTLYRDGDYKIFAVFITNSLSSQDNGNFFNYMKTDFKSSKEFMNWVNEAKLRSVINTNIDVNENDEILTLQTCNESFISEGKKARLIVMARRTRDGEDKKTDTSTATKNKNPKYPQMWYDVNGQVNPYYNNGKPTTTTTTTTKKKTTTTTTTTTTTQPTVATVVAPTVATKNTTTTKKTTTKKTTKTTKKTTTTNKPPKTTQPTTIVVTTVNNGGADE